MQETRHEVTGRDRMDGTAPPERTGERPVRPQWEGLFVEPDWPSDDVETSE